MGPRQTTNQKDFPAILKYISQTRFQILFPFASLEKVERRKANSASSFSFSFLKATTSLISSPIEDFSENLQPKFCARLSSDAQIEFLSDGIDALARLGGRGASFHLVRIYHSASNRKSAPTQISIFQISNTCICSTGFIRLSYHLPIVLLSFDLGLMHYEQLVVSKIIANIKTTSFINDVKHQTAKIDRNKPNQKVKSCFMWLWIG